ncbi:MAG: hypothetical protein ABI035_12065 [Gemmatimonadaceae bacterium]
MGLPGMAEVGVNVTLRPTAPVDATAESVTSSSRRLTVMTWSLVNTYDGTEN